MSQVAIVIDTGDTPTALLGTQLEAAKAALNKVRQDMAAFAGETLANELPTTVSTVNGQGAGHGNDTSYTQTARTAATPKATIDAVTVSASALTALTLAEIAANSHNVEVAGANTTTATATGVKVATSVLLAAGGIKTADQTYVDFTTHTTITADDQVTFDNDASAYEIALVWYDPS